MTTIHRRKLSEHFTVLPNQLLCDKRLSFKARGLLVMMLSKPENWKTNASWIEDQATEGREALQGAFKELETFGYLKRVCERDPQTKRVTCMTWHWSDSSSPPDGIPDDGLPSDGEPSSTKNGIEKEQSFPELKNSGTDLGELFTFSKPVEKEVVLAEPPKRRGRPPKPADPRHSQFIDAFCSAHFERVGERYFVKAQDGAMLKKLLTHTDKPVEELMEIVKWCWYRENEDKFCPKDIKVSEIWHLAAKWNTIIKEAVIK